MEGEEATSFFHQLSDSFNPNTKMDGETYADLMAHFIDDCVVRPKFGTHPRLQILGQIEARLNTADRIILAGLNEGTWPADPGHDPWMSRPMREAYGLPTPERSLTLSAHDFVQNICAGTEIFLSRGVKQDGAETVPARWLSRLETYCQVNDYDPAHLKTQKYQEIARHFVAKGPPRPAARPVAYPPVTARPRTLPVTQIDVWRKDPYALYAARILKLKKINPLHRAPDAADRGTLLHQIMHDYKEAQKNQDGLPDMQSLLNHKIRENLQHSGLSAQDISFWQPKLLNLIPYIIAHEEEWHQTYKYLKGEVKGQYQITETDPVYAEQKSDGNFLLTARFDRLDLTAENHLAVIDYKSGGSYSKTKLIRADLPQLPLEALIARKGSLETGEIGTAPVTYMGYWVMKKHKDGLQTIALDKDKDIETAMENAAQGLRRLIRAYQRPGQAYIAQPDPHNILAYNDYPYLERAKEWQIAGGADD
jgi:ATP-dependent helicase/nuclease subunit B